MPVPSADAWQMSNPPILAMAPLRTSFAIFDEAGGMEALRAKSVRLTGYLQFLLDRAPIKLFTVITPPQPNERRFPAFDSRPRTSERIVQETRGRRREERFPRAERHPRRADAALQHLSRSLALRADPQRAPLTWPAPRENHARLLVETRSEIDSRSTVRRSDELRPYPPFGWSRLARQRRWPINEQFRTQLISPAIGKGFTRNFTSFSTRKCRI